jgi:hypothetical protein
MWLGNRRNNETNRQPSGFIRVCTGPLTRLRIGGIQVKNLAGEKRNEDIRKVVRGSDSR